MEETSVSKQMHEAQAEGSDRDAQMGMYMTLNPGMSISG